MPSDLRMRASCVLLLLAAACSSDDDEKLGMAPDEFVREAPTLGATEPPDGGLDAGEEFGRFQFGDGGGVPCCDKTFSLPATFTGETAVTVRGDGALLGTVGLRLTKKDGKWTGALCLPPDQAGIYYYELAFPAEENDGGVSDDPNAGSFYDQRYNPSEPTTSSAIWGTVNAFVPKDEDCK